MCILYAWITLINLLEEKHEYYGSFKINLGQLVSTDKMNCIQFGLYWCILVVKMAIQSISILISLSSLQCMPNITLTQGYLHLTNSVICMWQLRQLELGKQLRVNIKSIDIYLNKTKVGVSLSKAILFQLCCTCWPTTPNISRHVRPLYIRWDMQIIGLHPCWMKRNYLNPSIYE